MAIYNFESEQIGELVFETITSPCEYCPIKHNCYNFIKQGDDRCIEMVTSHYENKHNQ